MWICIAPRREHTPLMRSRMARVLKGSHSNCTPRIRPLIRNERCLFLHTRSWSSANRLQRDGRLSWPGWLWLHTEINVRHRELNQDTVTHRSTNRARRGLTSLIEANALTTTPDHHRMFLYIFLDDCQSVNSQLF